MKPYLRWLLLGGVLVATIATVFLLNATLGAGETAAAPALPVAPAAPAAPPVIFPPDPGWPTYAQREITVNPEPPILGQPVLICAAVLNTSTQPQTVVLDFGIANFGIGLPFDPIGSRTVVVPPNGKAHSCVTWIPRQPGHRCLQVILHQPGQPDQLSQRNLDVWELLVAGEPAETVFPVRNPGTATDTIQLQLRNLRAGWTAIVTPQELTLAGGESRLVTLTVTPPRGELLGSRETIVDVEAYNSQGLPIGGFRKLDTPPVPLHRLFDPPYAESEISIEPYPPLPNEPVNLCVELYNLSDQPQPVESFFDIAAFGIGLPFTPVGMRSVVVPAHGRLKACISWIPPAAGHYCVQVRLVDPLHRYRDQRSQRNMDVSEILKPGQPDTFTFLVGNPLTIPTTLYLTTTVHLPGWEALLSPDVLPNMEPGQVMPVALTVFPPADLSVLDDGVPVLDVEAYTAPIGGELIGGFRKIFRPPIPIHRPEDPPYGESEISIEPYPPRAGEPVIICTDLRNPTMISQTVQVEFGVANFGIGIPFTRIDLQGVTLPPRSQVRVCTRWVPPIGGHFCAQIIIRQPGYRDVFSQRNMDVAEFLEPGRPNTYVFPVGNPYEKPITVTLGLVEHLPGWEAFLTPEVLYNLQPHTTRPVTLTVIPAPAVSVLEDGAPVVDVEAYTEEGLLGGFRKIFRPPIPIHHPADPPYAEREITVEPYPPRAGEPMQLCVDLRNPTAVTQTVELEFAWANFGIGLPFQTIQWREVQLPPNSLTRHCVNWVPPTAGHFCFQVKLVDPLQRFPTVRSQRNIDIGEIFTPGQWTEPFVFRVSNPFTYPTTIELAALVRLEGWQAELTPRILPQVAPGEVRPVTLTVRPPAGVPLPEDDTPIVDVEGHAAGQLIGGFRKIFRPPVPIHRPQDPIYAESEITINPYPPRASQPTEICVDLRNPTNAPQTMTVTFAVANFGIGLPFHDIARPIVVTLPPNSIKRVCVTWVPPFGGHFCARVTIWLPGHEPIWSQRNMDVGEILVPGEPSHLRFPVGNPTQEVVTVTLGLVPHLPNWAISLSSDVLPAMLPGETRLVTLTVVPPRQNKMPEPGSPVVDVEAFLRGQLIGGIRKLYYPPVPVHPPQDPIYAESEIFIDPYPTRVGLPTLLGAVVFNPTPVSQWVTVTFGVAHFGIGMPFTLTGIISPVQRLLVPPYGMARAKTAWIPQFNGHVCVQILVRSPGLDPVRSQRNIDIGEPLRPDRAHARIIEVRNPTTEVVTITMALISHRPDWLVELTPRVLPNMVPGEVRPVTLTVKPPTWEGLADEKPIVDVEAYLPDGTLIGGIRKLAKPPIPLHKPQDRPYAETEISVTPYPLQAGRPTTITTEVINTSEVTQTVLVRFGVANFGMGITFTNTNIVPTYRVVTLTPGLSTTVSAVWTPPSAGHWCIQIILEDPRQEYPAQRSQRNVEVHRRQYQPCQPITSTFQLSNSGPLTVTVDIGANAINLPPGWTYSTNITQTVLGPRQSITVTLTITPPCQLSASALNATLATNSSGGPPEINVEGYVDGELLGGIQVQLEGAMIYPLYLPLVLRNY